MNLDLIEKEFDPSDLEDMTVGEKTFTYVKIQAIQRRLNEVFDYLWSARVTSKDIYEDEVVVSVELVAEGIIKEAFGGQKIARFTGGPNKGEPVSLENDFKSAGSNALKKCAMLWGIGLYLSEGKGASANKSARTNAKTTGTVTDAQLGKIKHIRTQLGWSADDVVGMCARLFKTEDVANLNKTQASSLIAQLEKHLAAAGNGGGIPFLTVPSINPRHRKERRRHLRLLRPFPTGDAYGTGDETGIRAMDATEIRPGSP